MEEPNIRQNKDLIQSLNDIYEMNLKIQKELEQLKREVKLNQDNMNEKIRHTNNLVMETKNSLSQKLRTVQLESTQNTQVLEKLEEGLLDIEVLKDDNQFIQDKLDRLNNDVIKIQSVLIKNDDKIYEEEDEKEEEDEEPYLLESVMKSRNRDKEESMTRKKEIKVEAYEVREIKHPFQDILNPKTKI